MKFLMALSLVLVTSAACGSGSEATPSGPDSGASPDRGANPDSATGVPILAVNGTISAAGRNVVPTYGVAGSGKTGTSVGVILSDAPMDCSALTAEYTSKNMPAAGTYVSVVVSSFDPGVASTNFVQFMVIPKFGSIGGGGSNTGTVEVVEASDTAVTIKVEYRDSMSDGDYTVSGSFTVTRCP